jgi:membrane-associated phospholipid phosphatase
VRTLKQRLLPLETLDLVNVVFFAILAVGMLACARAIPQWWVFAVVDVCFIVVVFVLAGFASTRGHGWRLLHGYYMMGGIPLAFKEVYYLVPAIHPVDYDQGLIAFDRWLFGVDPTVWLARFAHPAITELLQLSYASFYLLPLVLTIDLYRKKRMQAFRIVFLAVILGFYLSYFGYLAVPAIGPRFTLHDYYTLNRDLPGLLLTSGLRVYTDTGESIPPGTVDAAAKVQRDAFPSGHTLVTLLVIFFAFRYRARTRWILFTAGTLLIVATVYLRYHYVIDVIAGAASAVIVYYIMRFVDRRWIRTRKRWGGVGVGPL